MKTIIFAISLLLTASYAFAHEGHDKMPGDEETAATSATITLPDNAIKNLGIKTEVATLAPLAKTLDMNATIQFLPEKDAQVTPKVASTVSEILVTLGQKVTKGQGLVRITPLNVGSSAIILTAPITGVVVKQNTVLGQPITPETIIIEIADTSQLLVKGITYETPELGLLKVGQKAKAIFALTPDKIFTGNVQRLDVSLDKDTRTFDVYALIDNSDGTLRANMQATLSVELGEPQQALTIPAKAVIGELGSFFVFVREGDNFERRNVVLGLTAGNRVEVIDGVLPDEEVVTVGNYQLQYVKSQAPAKHDEALPKKGEH